jgi:hypothetical protein
MAPACHGTARVGQCHKRQRPVPAAPLRTAALASREVTRGAAVTAIVIVGVVIAIHGRSQPSGAAHGGAVKGVDHATDEAYLVGLVRLAVYPGMRPGKIVPAAHFDEAFQDRTCHICHEVFDSTKVSPNYSVTSLMRASLLDTGPGFKASAWSHYSVTVGGVM